MGPIGGTISVPVVLIAFGLIHHSSVSIEYREDVLWIELDVFEHKPVVLSIAIGRENIDELNAT